MTERESSSPSIGYGDDLVHEMMTLLSSRPLAEENVANLISDLLRRFVESSSEDGTLVSQFVTEVAIPALLEPTQGSNAAVFAQRSIRDQLPRIVDALPPQERNLCRKTIYACLRELIGELNQPVAKSALRVLGSLGFRDSATFNRLLELLRARPPHAWEILVAIATLAVPKSNRTELLPIILDEISKPPHNRTAGLIQEMFQQRWFDETITSTITTLAIPSMAKECKNWLDASRILNVLGWTADATRRQPEAHGTIWTAVRALQNGDPELFRPAIELTSCLTETVDDERMILDLLNWQSEGYPGPDVPKVAYWRLYVRLSECVHPRSVQGWRAATRAGGAWLAAVTSDATGDTGNDSRFATIEMHTKEQAWETLLCLGVHGLVELGALATCGEANPYVAQHTYELLAGWPGMVLTEHVRALIESDFDVEQPHPANDLCRRLGVVRFAAGIASIESFSSLLACGITAHGSALVSACEALAQVALALAREQQAGVTEALWSTATTARQPHNRDMAIFALRELAAHSEIDCAHVKDFLTLASDTTLPDFSREAAIESIRNLDQSDDETADSLIAFWREDAPERVRWAAADCLAQRGWIERLDNASLRKDFGIERRDGRWSVLGSASFDRRCVFALALLYCQSPCDASDIAVHLLKTVDGTGLYALIRPLRSVGFETPVSVVDAVIDRILELTRPGYAELELFSLLSSIAPANLGTTRWESSWTRWHPEARVSLANALHEIEHVDQLGAGDLARILVLLSGDGLYAVRRAAYRALSRHVADALIALRDTWMKSEDPEFRKRAAEASAWADGGSDVPSELAELLVDCEPEVRDAARRAAVEYSERRLARFHAHAINSAFESNQDVPDIYANGRALIRVGDDFDAAELRSLGKRVMLKPHQRNWVGRVAASIDKRWKDVTAKWPQPWIRLDGIVEEVEGTVEIAGTIFRAYFTLWASHQEAPSEFGSWAGLLVVLDVQDSIFSLRIMASETSISMTISGRVTATAHLTRALNNSSFLIVGNGMYPRVDDSPWCIFRDEELGDAATEAKLNFLKPLSADDSDANLVLAFGGHDSGGWSGPLGPDGDGFE